MEGCPEAVPLDRIYENLRTEYKYYIRSRNFTSLPELLELTSEFERLPRTTTSENRALSSPRVRFETNTAPVVPERSPDRIPVVPPSRSETPIDNQGSNPENRSDTYQRKGVCWRCGKAGHQRKNCGVGKRESPVGETQESLHDIAESPETCGKFQSITVPDNRTSHSSEIQKPVQTVEDCRLFLPLYSKFMFKLHLRWKWNIGIARNII